MSKKLGKAYLRSQNFWEGQQYERSNYLFILRLKVLEDHCCWCGQIFGGPKVWGAKQFGWESFLGVHFFGGHFFVSKLGRFKNKCFGILFCLELLVV